jgi:hypothetical protein
LIENLDVDSARRVLANADRLTASG